MLDGQHQLCVLISPPGATPGAPSGSTWHTRHSRWSRAVTGLSQQCRSIMLAMLLCCGIAAKKCDPKCWSHVKTALVSIAANTVDAGCINRPHSSTIHCKTSASHTEPATGTLHSSTFQCPHAYIAATPHNSSAYSADSAPQRCSAHLFAGAGVDHAHHKLLCRLLAACKLQALSFC
jgi:hypothetical protein